jgi:hypothetical protein
MTSTASYPVQNVNAKKMTMTKYPPEMGWQNSEKKK